MPRVSIHNLGRVGIIHDIPPHELPPEAWSDGRNVIFRDVRTVKTAGHSPVFGTPNIPPYWAMAVPTPTRTLWLYTSLTKASVFDGLTHSDMTRASGDYTTSEVDLWHGQVFGGIPIINNGIDIPQFWGPQVTTQPLQDLSNWPTTLRAKALRQFKRYLIALNVTKSGTPHPHMVKTSHPAAPGTLPGSWDATDPTKDAREFELDDTQAGQLREGLPLGDVFIAYKDNSTWGMQLVGGRFIFRVFNISETSGILGTNCVVQLNHGPFGNMRQHAVLTGDDFVAHNGQSVVSLLENRWRRFLNNKLSSNSFTRSFLVHDMRLSRVWVCFPEMGQTLPSLALVWNYINNTIGVKELQSFPYIAAGNIGDLVDSDWDSDSQVWDNDNTVWDVKQFSQADINLLICDPNTPAFYHADLSNQFNNVPMTSYVERRGLAIAGVDRQGNPKADISRKKLWRRLWPKLRGGPVQIRVGAQNEEQDPVTWGETFTFTPGVDQYIDPFVSGRFMALRIESSADVSWDLDSYTAEIELLGEH